MSDTAEQQLAAFGAWCLAEHREGFGDLDGGQLQESAQALGLIVPVMVTEPCGEDCACAEWGDFPQECLRLTKDLQAAGSSPLVSSLAVACLPLLSCSFDLRIIAIFKSMPTIAKRFAMKMCWFSVSGSTRRSNDRNFITASSNSVRISSGSIDMTVRLPASAQRYVKLSSYSPESISCLSALAYKGGIST